MYKSYIDHVAKHGEKNTTIDRINSSGNYELANCRWATYRVQAWNTTHTKWVTIDEETLPIFAWCKKIGINKSTVYHRLSKGWNIVEALTSPTRSLRN